MKILSKINIAIFLLIILILMIAFTFLFVYQIRGQIARDVGVNSLQYYNLGVMRVRDEIHKLVKDTETGFIEVADSAGNMTKLFIDEQ